MVWEPQNGEVVYPDKVGDIWFGNFLSGFYNDGVNGNDYIIDFDDTLRASGPTSDERFMFVSNIYWGHVDVDYVQDVDDLTAAGVRRDCDGPLYEETFVYRDGESFLFTCMVSVTDRYSVAGDIRGVLWVQDHNTMTQAHYPVSTEDNPVVRVLMGYTTTPNIMEFFGFRYDATVVQLTLNIATGAVTSAIHDLKIAGDVDGDNLAGQVIADVCGDKSNRRFMIKTATDLYFFQWQSAVAPFWRGVIAQAAWDTANNEMLAMEFVTNDWVLIMGTNPGLCSWYKTPKLDVPTAGALTTVAINIEGNHKWTHLIPYDDGSKVIAVGIFYGGLPATRGYTGEHSMGVYSIDVSTGQAVTPNLLFTFDANPIHSGWWQSYAMFVDGTWAPSNGEVYRGRRRWGTNEFWLVTSGRQEILTVGKRLASSSFSSNALTSTSNLINWHPPTDDEFENIAWQIVERSHCAKEGYDQTKYYCVWAWDKWSGLAEEEGLDEGWPCQYIDNQHPEILPQERDALIPDVFGEVGLITQAEIHDFDPRLDDFPSGRQFWYKYRKVSYLNIESKSSVNPATTRPPIQPVEVKDTKDMNLNWNDIIVTSRDILLEWDWIPLGSTAAADFLMWQVAFFEDQNPTEWIGAWAGWQHYPQPRLYPGTLPGGIWRYILPWEVYPSRDDTTGHPLICWADGVNFKSGEKTRLVDRKYLRWTDDAETTEDDKRYSRLLPDTVYTAAVIGWDNGGLWRASAKMTHVPPSVDTFDNEEMIVDRQVLSIRTEPETSFAAICNFDKLEEHMVFQRWDELLDPPAFNFLPVDGTPLNASQPYQKFFVEYEVQISGYEFYIDAIVGNPGSMQIGIRDNDPATDSPAPFANWVPGSTQTIPAADLQVGWNRVVLNTPFIIRPGIYHLGFTPWPLAWGGGDEIRIRSLQWPGDTGHGVWFIDVAWTRTQFPDQDLMCRILFDTTYISEGFVTESGEELTFDFQKSTITDGDLPIFEDNAYADTGIWDTIIGNAGDWGYAGGRLDIITTADLFLLANTNDYYGIETRNGLIKTRWRYNEGTQTACTDLLYETAAPYNLTRVFGDVTGADNMAQVAGELQFVADTDVCAISVFVDSKVLTGFYWEAELSLQGDAAGAPDNIKLTFARISAAALVPGWNKFTFPITVTLTGGVPYWFVVEPSPCPISSGGVDRVTLSTKTPPPTWDMATCSVLCIPLCNWVPLEEEIASRIWGPEVIPIESAPICFLLHEQGKHEDVDFEAKGYWVCYDLVTGDIIIDQYRFRLGANTWWDNTAGAAAFPGEFAAQDEWFDIWFKIVDDCISVFVEKDGNTVEENYEFGNSIAHQQIFRDGTDYYDFSRYGYLMLKIPSGISVSMDYYRAYGQHELTNLSGGQGAFMDWGDDSDSGYIPAMDISKIYAIEPDDDTEAFDAKVHGKNWYNNIDLGFVPSWIDYPDPIKESDYERQTYEMWVDNAPPTAVINGPTTGYSGINITFDAVGSLDPEGGGLTYFWDFDDGTTETTTTPFVQHAFAITGTYQVSLRVRDEIGLYSSFVYLTVVIGELFADFFLIDLNHPLQKEDVTRATGFSSTNIADLCGGEQQDAGPGNRVFNIQGIHTPPRCCCDDATDWRLVLDLESICTTHYTFEEEIGSELVTLCTLNQYQSPGTNDGQENVGDDNAGTRYQQANEMTMTSDMDVCGVSLYPEFSNLSGFPWNVKVSIQADVLGAPSGISLAEAGLEASLWVMGTWNKLDFGTTITLLNGNTYWLVAEPEPCPIGSGAVDIIEFNKIFQVWPLMYSCTPQCIPGCAWAPAGGGAPPLEMMMILWGPTTVAEATTEDVVASSFQTGCCDIEAVPYTGGVGQSFTTTDLNYIDDATAIQLRIPMCRSADFDGDIDVRLYCDLLGGAVLSTPEQVSIDNADIPVCENGPTEYVTVAITVCPFQIVDTKLYVTLTPAGATAGSFSVVSTTPFSDKYHFGEKYLLIDGTWTEQTYEDICMKIYTMSDCELLGCCESKYLDWLWCTRKLVRIDLPCFGLIGGRIVNYKAGKTTNEPFAWLPFTLTIEEIKLEQLGCG